MVRADFVVPTNGYEEGVVETDGGGGGRRTSSFVGVVKLLDSRTGAGTTAVNPMGGEAAAGTGTTGVESGAATPIAGATMTLLVEESGFATPTEDEAAAEEWLVASGFGTEAVAVGSLELDPWKAGTPKSLSNAVSASVVGSVPPVPVGDDDCPASS